MARSTGGVRPLDDRQARLEATLDALIGTKGFLGAALVSRDGIPVVSRFTPSFSQVTFSLLVQGAMVATLMGAAEVAVKESEGGRTRRVLVESERIAMVVVGATEGLLLVAIAEASLPLTALLPPIEQAAKTVAALVAG